jgi:hypothetical protein
MTNPAEFMEAGQDGAIDIRIGHDSSGPPNNWRRDTPPAGEDGTVPDRRLTISDQNDVATGPGTDVTHPVYPSTFDIPDSEMG